MKIWPFIALVAFMGASAAFAQELPRMPAPLPLFHAPKAPADFVAPGPVEAAGDLAPAPKAQTATEAIQTATAEPQPVRLSAIVTDGGRTLADGLTWRVFGSKADAAGHLELAAESESPVANLKLVPGNYLVHVAYGRAQASDTITVAEGPNNKNIVLEVGGLRLNAAISGEVPIPINLLRFDVFSAGTSEADRAIVAQGIGANDILTLNAGTYHIVSYFGDVNAIVRADLRVEPGEVTDVTLYHRAAQVSFKLVSEPGGEAIADIDWTVKTADGASTVFTDTGAFPSTVLQEGTYLVFAKRGDTVFNREFEIQPGQPHEIEVLTTVY